MPTYGYRCGSCGHEFEIRQRITEEALVTCPKCGGKLSKMLYPAGIIFKGSGYYTTDYKGSGNGSAGSSNGVAPASASEGSADTKPETKSESKSESKVETKSEPKTESKPSKPESKSGSTDKKGS
jgi:putative FmdB family regulatory protein